jgi:hypothetical protein
VLVSAPDNLSAIRGLAQIHERHGLLSEALTRYQAALSLAPNDPELEETVARVSRETTAAAGERGKASRTVVALEQWLDAVHAARSDRRA